MLLEKTVVSETYSPIPHTQTVLDCFEDHLEHYAHHIAISDNDKDITYGSLNRKANALAKHLKAQGVLPNSIIAIYLEPSIEFVLSILAILKTGSAYLPLDTETPVIRIEHILQDGNPAKIISNTYLALHLASEKDKIISLNTLDLTEIDYIEKNPARCADDLLYVMYTSSSTGAPKGCRIPHRAAMNLIYNQNLILYPQGSRMAQISNVSFDAATFEIWGALLHRIELFIFPRSQLVSIDAFSEFLDQKNITILFLTTAYFNLIVRNKPECLDNLQYLLFGGEKSNPDITNCLLDRKKSHHLDHLNILHVYGPTENTTFSTQYVLQHNDHYDKTVPIGTALSGITLYILDENGQEVPSYTQGELYLSGKSLALGYLNDPQKTKNHFIHHPVTQELLYKTGDFVYRDTEGLIYFVGRKDNQIKIRGNRVELGEIEAVLSEYEFIDQVFVDFISQPNELSIVAYIIPLLKGTIQRTDFYYFLHKNLPDYMIPKKIYLIDKFPLNQNGKIDKQALSHLPLKTIFSSDEIHLPANKIETGITHILAELINETHINPQHNFFDLGVNSLIVIEACAKLNQKIYTQHKIEEIDFFTHPTVELLAKYIADNKENRELIHCPNRADMQRKALLLKRHDRK